MLNKYKTGLLLVILVLGAFLRLYQLGSVPPSPDWDEAALSYNGYSILHTGRDEYGAFLPVVLRSFDDYKPALYSYLTIPTTIIFGMNTFSTRLPSAVFGIVTLWIVYLLVKELFRREDLALLSAFLLAISPWHIQFSRIAFESNIGLSLNIVTAYFFIKALKKPWMLSFSAGFAALALYAYQSEKVFTPLLVLALVLIYCKELFRMPKKFLAAGIICGLLVASPMLIYLTTNKDAWLRAQATLAFADQTSFLQNQVKRIAFDREHKDYLGLVLDNRRVLFLVTGIGGYLSHYDFNWLFIKGDIDRHHAPGMGLMYLWELPFLLIGIYLLIFAKLPDSSKKSKYVLFAWFLLAPVPAAFTSEVPHAVRTLNFLPTFQIFSAWAILAVIGWVGNYRQKLNKVFSLGLILASVGYLFFALGNFVYYLDQYFVQLNYFDAEEWQYGYQQAVAYVQQVQGDYRKIVVSDSQPFDKSYIFFLFYLHYPPERYQQEEKSKAGGYATHQGFGKYEFRPIHWSQETDRSGTLYVMPYNNDNGGTLLKTIYNPDGTPAVLIVKG
ncbi:MAG TPA: glycosyltransferase family 39 protein [Patescibacteria group bacterium]|nr:glycosyltransferase family 39 protein [Patescibacteria group bacterium]